MRVLIDGLPFAVDEDSSHDGRGWTTGYVWAGDVPICPVCDSLLIAPGGRKRAPVSSSGPEDHAVECDCGETFPVTP